MINARPLLATLLAIGFVATLAAGALAQVSTGPGTRPVEDPLFEVRSVVPESWQDLGGGAYARGTPPEDLALLVVQAAAATRDQLWSSLLPQLALEEVPAPSGTYRSDAFEWTLHRVEITVPGLESIVEIGLAEGDGRLYLLMLQSPIDEYETLREQVLVPALDATAPLEPEPTPDPSTFDYDIEEVVFPGGADDVTLAGTLTLPEGPGPHPVVVLMSGSGAQDRDESLKPITTLKPFAILADALTSAGIGVLRYDDRGVGGSTGDYAAATVQELAEDARAALDYLATRDDVDAGRLGLFGHSEGGLYAAMLGASDPRVAWIGMMAPAVADGVSLMTAQNEALQRAEGESEASVEATVEFSRAVLPAARDGDVELVADLTTEFYRGVWDRLGDEGQAVAGDREAWAERTAQGQVELFTSDWFRSLLAYDPAVDWAEVTVPVLAIFAGKDVQVVAEQNETALREALEAAGNDDLEIITFDDANHLFQEAETGAFSEYSRLEPEFIDGFVEAIVDWMTVRAGVAG